MEMEKSGFADGSARDIFVGRPQMPAGYGIGPEHTSEMLPWSVVSDRLARERNYWVATTHPDGRPHVMPVWGLWLEQTFYFATDPASRKARNLEANPNVVVHLESGDDVVVLEGSAEAVVEPSLLQRFAEAYEIKYRFRPEVNGTTAKVYCLRPEVAFAWQEKDFPRSATRWSFSDYQNQHHCTRTSAYS
jgi:PPOX class probable F420-dependent enzyme